MVETKNTLVVHS